MKDLEFFEKISHMIPLFRTDNISYMREERKNYISVHSNRAPWLQEVFLNFTMQKILVLCDGYTNVEKIVDVFYRLYDYKIAIDQIKVDIVKGLEELSMCKLIDWEEGNPFMKRLNIITEGKEFSLIEEKDIKELMSFITRKVNSNEVNYVHIMSDQDVYKEEVYIRDKLFNFTEDFYILKSNEEIIGLISLILPRNRSTVSTVGILIADTEINEMILISNLLKSAQNVTEFNITKTKFQFVMENYLKTELVSLGFIKECTLKSEIGVNDVEVYSYFYEGEVV